MTRSISRRGFLAGSGAVVAAGCTSDSTTADPEPTLETQPDTPSGSSATAEAEPTPTTEPSPTAEPTPAFAADPFGLGVASGDPLPDSVILWTRLIVDPLEPSDASVLDVAVTWEVASDEAFGDVVADGTQTARPQNAHSVHVDVTGLEADTWYWYRFKASGFTSPLGRTRTMPRPSQQTPLTFGFSSCQNYEQGFFAAHEHLASSGIDLFFWLGDYIYEYGPGEFPIEGATGEVRVHNTPEIRSVDDYRRRYALYRSDPQLQQHHAAHPWVITWDDHEVDNDHAGDIAEDGAEPTDFSARRAAAYQAWYEHMPVRLDPPSGSDFTIYRTIEWGSLAEFFVLDGRQYRDDQPTDGEIVVIPGLTDETGDVGIRALGPTALDPEHRLLGADQQAWLLNGLRSTSATWSVLAQQVFMHGVNLLPGNPSGPVTTTDTWDGYAGNRAELLDEIEADGPENLVVLSGDFHSATAAELRADPFDAEKPVVGSEFMASSISSRFPDIPDGATALVLAVNPHIKLFDVRKGYCIATVDAQQWVTQYFAVDDPLDATSGVAQIAAFRIEAGTPGPMPVE